VAEPSGEESFPEPPEGLVTPDQDSVVAFLDSADELGAAIDELAEQGFDRDSVWVLCGPEGAERLDVGGKHHGLTGKVYRLIEWMSDEKGLLFRAREHLQAGGLVVSVPADEEHKAAAARVLGAHGARQMAHFGPNHWEPLGSG
jgi:hypothetical protein